VYAYYFFAACLEYANKANHMLILPFQQNQVKTYEKSENGMCGVIDEFYLGVETGGPSYETGNNQGEYHQLENI
jgi:hypothetical protein